MGTAAHTILIVEDNDDIRLLFTAVFSLCGMNVLATHTLRDACKLFEVGVQIDAIMVDYTLPDGVGPNILTLLGDKLPKVRVLVTGHNITHPGFSECFTKPVDMGLLCRSVRSGLEEVYHATSEASGACGQVGQGVLRP